MPGRLIIICGLPGAGKTTRAKALEHSLGAVRFCADEWMGALGMNLWGEGARGKIEALQWKFARRLLGLGQTVLIEWGTWGRSEREFLRDGANALGARVELHFMSAPLEVLLERIRARGMEQPGITRQQLDQWAAAFEVPTQQEAASYDRFWANADNNDPEDVSK